MGAAIALDHSEIAFEFFMNLQEVDWDALMRTALGHVRALDHGYVLIGRRHVTPQLIRLHLLRALIIVVITFFLQLMWFIETIDQR